MTGSSIIVANLAKQFSRDEMVVAGAYWMSSPPITWQPEHPKLRYVALQPPGGTRGERWMRWAQLPFILIAVLWLMLVERVQVVFTIYPDMIYLCVGYFASVILRKPLLVYFHNTLVEARPKSSFAHWLQARVFARAKYVLVMSEGMQKLYEELYPSLRCAPLVHSFNDPLPTFDSVAEGVNSLHTPLRIAYSGSINRSNFGAVETTATALCELTDMTFTVYTGTGRATLKRLGLDFPGLTITSASRDVLIEKLREADVLLLLHGFTDTNTELEIRTIFPTKTIEYMLSGRPIIALLPGDSFLADYLRRHDCAVLVTENDAEQLNAAIREVQANTALRERLVRNALCAVQQFSAPHVAAVLRSVMSEYVWTADRTPLEPSSISKVGK